MTIRSRRLIVALVILAVLITGAFAAVTWRKRRAILLGGTVVTPGEVIAHGWVLIEDGKISLVSASKPNAPGATEVDTGGIIFPGLIDLHNHISWDVLPRWHPTHLFADRYEWRNDPEYVRQDSAVYDDLLDAGLFCEMNAYGELRALAGGTTSILATANDSCIRGLVRNLDHSSGFYGFLEPDSVHIRNEVNIQAADTPKLQSVKTFLANSRTEMFIVHLSEGVDQASLDEFYWFKNQGLLSRKSVIIHGVALGPTEFRAMHAAGAALVWSPRSNVELYGTSADIPAALDAGLLVGLAPDWAITGSSNMLDELHYAAQWDAEHFSDRLTDEQLVAMVTTTAAEIAGIDDEVGAIEAGRYADLLVISGDRDHPYRALIEAEASDVQLVLIGGEPLYGTPALMAGFWDTSGLSIADVDGQSKMIKMPDSSVSFDDLVSKLQAALTSFGTSLAPLTESR
jgi:cytosine/adenosine deaminase-related metal-dependent hydrolase